MATSDVSICNSALIKLGAGRIKSLSGTTKEAELCNQRYADCRDVVLQAYPWKCAIKRVVLSPLSTGPAFGDANAFQVPSDFIRQLPDEETGELLSMEGSTILSGGSTINLRYIARITDPTIYPPYLAECMALRLAADLCYALQQSAQKQQLQEQLYENALKRAKFLDSSTNKAPKVFNADYLINSRYNAATLGFQP